MLRVSRNDVVEDQDFWNVKLCLRASGPHVSKNRNSFLFRVNQSNTKL